MSRNRARLPHPESTSSWFQDEVAPLLSSFSTECSRLRSHHSKVLLGADGNTKQHPSALGPSITPTRPDWPTVRGPRAIYWHACFAMFRDTQAGAQLSTSLNWPDGHQSGPFPGTGAVPFLAFSPSWHQSVGWQRSHSSILPWIGKVCVQPALWSTEYEVSGKKPIQISAGQSLGRNVWRADKKIHTAKRRELSLRFQHASPLLNHPCMRHVPS